MYQLERVCGDTNCLDDKFCWSFWRFKILWMKSLLPRDGLPNVFLVRWYARWFVLSSVVKFGGEADARLSFPTPAPTHFDSRFSGKNPDIPISFNKNASIVPWWHLDSLCRCLGFGGANRFTWDPLIHLKAELLVWLRSRACSTFWPFNFRVLRVKNGSCKSAFGHSWVMFFLLRATGILTPRIWFASLMRKVVPLIVVEWLLDSEI